MECFVHIVILPNFGRCLKDGLQAHVVGFPLQVITGDVVLSDGSQVTLRSYQHNRSIGADLPNFGLPRRNVVQTQLVVDSDAKHEDVSLVVADLAITTEISITTSVVDLQLDLLILKELWAFEHV